MATEMTGETVTRRAKAVFGKYSPARYICPHCGKRFGEATKCLMMDVKRCDKCPALHIAKDRSIK